MLHYALLSVLTTAVHRITLKHCAVTSPRPWPALIVYDLLPVALLLPFFGMPALTELSGQQVCLLLLTGALFAGAGLLDILAMKSIDASTGEIFHTLTFIISVTAGFLLFGESCSVQKLLGTGLIALGIIFEARHTRGMTRHGGLYKMLSALLIAAAMIITKQLTETTPTAVIVLSGFLLPGLVYLACGVRDLHEILPSIRKSKGLLLLVPVFSALSYTFGIKALTGSEISTTYMVFQTSLVTVLLLEVVTGGWNRTVHLKRTIAGGLCLLGAICALAA